MKRNCLKTFNNLLVFLFFLLLGTTVYGNSQPYITDLKINFGSGNKYLDVTDMQLPSPGKIELSRVYNSQSDVTGIFGYGWFATGTEFLDVSGTDLVLVSHDGRYITFTSESTDTWVSVLGASRRTITKTDDGYLYSTSSLGTKTLFDDTGRLVKKTNKNGNVITYSYTSDLLTSISDDFGNTIALTYTDSKVSSITSTQGTVSYEYDSNDNLVKITKPDTTSVQYLYEDTNDVHNLTGVKNEEGTQVLFVEYDTEDRVVKASKQNGLNETTIEYSDLQRVVTNSLGISTTYQLEVIEGVYFVSSSEGPGCGCASCGCSTSSVAYSYNARGQITEEEDAAGIKTAYTYDDDGNKLTTTIASGTSLEKTTTYTYENDLVKTITRASAANSGQSVVTTKVYDANGNVASQTETGYENSTAISRTTSYTYNSYGQPLTTDGPRADVSDVTTLTYYDNTAAEGNNRAQLHTVANALGQTTTYSDYNVFGKPETITLPSGLVTTQQYNSRGLLISSTTGGVTTSYSYDVAGILQSITRPDSRVVSYNYNDAGLLEKVTDTLGNYIVYSYDTEGHKTEQDINDPGGIIKTYVKYAYYDTGKLETVTYADGSTSTYSYDDVGNLTGSIDALTQETVYAYDSLNRLTKTTAPGTTETTTGYDIHDNLTSVTDAEGKTTTYTYDDFGRRLTTTSPDTGTTTYTYDIAGNLVSKTDANSITVTYTYDAVNRPLTISYPDTSENITFTYDENGYIGQLTTMVDATGTTTYVYDALGRLTGETKDFGTQSFTTAYTYTDNSELKSIIYPGGRTVTYNYKTNGEIDSVTTTYGSTSTLVDSIESLPFGPITGMTLGNGIEVTNSYDQLYRLAQSEAGSVYNRSYSYYANSQVQTITDVITAANSQSFTYDDLNRLLTAQGSYGTMGYTYDKVGNRLTKTADAETTNYTYQTATNRLQQTTGTEITDYTYDTAGNIKTKGEVEFSWNQNNQISNVIYQANTIGTYGYDARGLRVKRTVNGNTIYTLYDQSGNLLVEADEDGHILRQYAYLGSQKLTLFDYSLSKDLTIHVATDAGVDIEGVKVYAFNKYNKYTGVYKKTDEEGNATFSHDSFTSGEYTFRVDYLKAQYWSDAIAAATATSAEVLIKTEAAAVTVTKAGAAQEGVKVYVFTEAGKYTGVYGVTDADGNVSFILPEGENYKFRADLLKGQYWSSVITVADGGSSTTIASGGGTLTYTVGNGGTPLSGIKTYLYSSAGKYLGKTVITDADGKVAYTVPEGTYMLRADYLKYKFWSSTTSVTAATSATLDIPLKNITITAQGSYQSDLRPYSDCRAYLYTGEGSYTGVYATTDANGQAVFTVPEKEFKVRVDYQKQKYWSDILTWEDKTLTVPEGVIALTVTQQTTPVSDVSTYLYNEAASAYLGLKEVTDSNGEALYRVPSGTYSVRADCYRSKYWGQVTVAADNSNPLTIDTGGGTYTLTLTDGTTPLEGVKTYLYSETGKYLRISKRTDSNGQVGYDIADGSYLIRMDYMGYQYWSNTFTVPDETASTYTIPITDITFTAIGDNNGDQQPISGVKAYLYTAAGTYVKISTTTDANGQAVFSVPAQAYMIRLDYLKTKYWSSAFTQTDTTLTVEEGDAVVTVENASGPLEAVPVYVYNDSGSYLKLKGTTDSNGQTSFRLPAANYTFRADYLKNHYSGTGLITAHQSNAITLDTGGGVLKMTVLSGGSSVLEGVKTYLFNSSGSYTGASATTDTDGAVSFDVADGSYKLRVDYLKYQYWSDDYAVPGVSSGSVNLNMVDTVITVNADTGLATTGVAGLRCYLFTDAGKYTGLYADTDTNGQAKFSLPPGEFKIRVDYQRQRFWSDTFDQTNTTITIPMGDLSLHITKSSADLEGAKVYVFSTAGKYTGLGGTTNASGEVSFSLPEGAFKVRIDTDGKKKFSDTINIIGYQLTQEELEFNDLTATNDPNPKRYDGEAPLYMPMIAAVGDIDGLFYKPVVGDPKTYYFIGDHLGSTQILTDSEKTVVWQAEYAPFGNTTITTNTINNNFRFPGQYYDAETGLYYNWHRFYDPETGRYISADPIGLDGGINLYAYVGGDPLGWFDPTGLKGGSVFEQSLNFRPNWPGRTPGYNPNNTKRPSYNPRLPQSDLDQALQLLLPDPGDPYYEPMLIPQVGFFYCLNYECFLKTPECIQKKVYLEAIGYLKTDDNKCCWSTGPFLRDANSPPLSNDPSCRCVKEVYIPEGLYF